MKNLVLIGSGHSHVAVLKSFGMKPLPSVRITVVCRDTHTPYSGMLPGLIAGHYSFDDAHIDVRRLAQFAGARFYTDEAIGLDLTDNRVLCREREPIPFNICSINIGSAPATLTVPGAADHAVPVKPISGFLDHWQQTLVQADLGNRPFAFGIVGAGAGGVELTLSAHHAVSKHVGGNDGSSPATFHLIDDHDRVTPTHNEGVSRRLARLLSSRGITVHTKERVSRVTETGLDLESGTSIALDAVLWTAQAAAPAWLKDTALDLTDDGFIRIDDCLRSTTHPHVFAAGDVATMVNHPREKAGVMAVRQGPPLADNVRRVLEGEAPRPFAPQKKWLSLISTGDRNAVASWHNWSAEGPLLWRWKDWIDQRFMDKHDTLPDMSSEPAPPSTDVSREAGDSAIDTLMRCGGCGAKVGSPVLSRVLQRLSGMTGHAVNEFEDAAIVTPPQGQILLQTIDFFRAFIDDPYIFGRIAAAHALGDIFAMGGRAHSALALAVVPPGPDDIVEEDLFLMLRGALDAFGPLNVSLMGGHSGEGNELALGFSVAGFATEDKLLRKKGLQEGDALILTKPLGTGALLAAHMQLKAKGRWIDAALDSMMKTSHTTADILVAHNATACTDVTGFGLAGHALEMANASGITCEIDLGLLPVLDGAESVMADGIRSTLHPQNARAVEFIANSAQASSHPLYALLFDPQTSGGLLAGVPQERVTACLGALSKAGETDARVIGRVKQGEPSLSLTGF